MNVQGTKFNSDTFVLSIPLGLSRDKIWREKLFLGLVQIEINLCTLLSICTKPRKSFSRQIFSRDKRRGIDNITKTKKAESEAQRGKPKGTLGSESRNAIVQ